MSCVASLKAGSQVVSHTHTTSRDPWLKVRSGYFWSLCENVADVYWLAWQTTERASVRLAARGSAGDPRYGDAAYYHAPGNGVYSPPTYPHSAQHQHQEPLYPQPSPPQLPSQPQPQQPRVVQPPPPPPPEKRHRSEEGEAAPKSKRTKSMTAKTSGTRLSLVSNFI